MSVTLPPPVRAAGRTIVITGASSGIGRAAARELALLGADLAIVGRDPDRTHAVARETGGTPYVADFDRLESVRELATNLLHDLPRIHVLANNAGGTAPRTDTADGYDTTFQRNHLAGFLLTELLLDRLRATARQDPAGGVRIVQTSSSANVGGRVRLDDLDTRRGPWLGGWRAYSSAKLENVLFTRELARRLRGTGIDAFSFHPGFVASNFGGGSPLIRTLQTVARSPEDGAAPLVRLAAAPEIPAPSGNHFDRLRAPGAVAPSAGDPALAAGLWAESARRAGLG